MTTFVLVHGGWSGAHSFRHVRPLLQAAGHSVFTPSLTGIGERAHLASPQVNLSTHVQDVVNQVLYEDLKAIVLLGFSYGGMVVTGAVEHVADRVRHLVYLDALVPSDGDSAFSLSGFGDGPPFGLGSPWLVPASPREYDDPVEGEFMATRRGPHPIGCFTERLRVKRSLEEHPFSRTFIKATVDDGSGAGAAGIAIGAARAKGSDKWRYREIATNHMVANNRPKDLAAMLTELD